MSVRERCWHRYLPFSPPFLDESQVLTWSSCLLFALAKKDCVIKSCALQIWLLKARLNKSQWVITLISQHLSRKLRVVMLNPKEMSFHMKVVWNNNLVIYPVLWKLIDFTAKYGILYWHRVSVFTTVPDPVHLGKKVYCIYSWHSRTLQAIMHKLQTAPKILF